MESDAMKQVLLGVPRWVRISCLVIVLSSWVDLAGTIMLGGDALGTRPVAGRFFVEEKGTRTEVSEGAWLLSLACSWFSYGLSMLTLSVFTACAAVSAMRQRYIKELPMRIVAGGALFVGAAVCACGFLDTSWQATGSLLAWLRMSVG